MSKSQGTAFQFSAISPSIDPKKFAGQLQAAYLDTTGQKMPRSTSLEVIARLCEFPNWNVMNGVLSKQSAAVDTSLQVTPSFGEFSYYLEKYPLPQVMDMLDHLHSFANRNDLLAEDCSGLTPKEKAQVLFDALKAQVPAREFESLFKVAVYCARMCTEDNMEKLEPNGFWLLQRLRADSEFIDVWTHSGHYDCKFVGQYVFDAEDAYQEHFSHEPVETFAKYAESPTEHFSFLRALLRNNSRSGVLDCSEQAEPFNCEFFAVDDILSATFAGISTQYLDMNGRVQKSLVEHWTIPTKGSDFEIRLLHSFF